MILQVEPVFKLKWFRRKTEEFELFRQKILRPNWTQAEGFVLGLGAKMFTIAGPVIVYGVVAAVLYGVVYWVMGILL